MRPGGVDVVTVVPFTFPIVAGMSFPSREIGPWFPTISKLPGVDSTSVKVDWPGIAEP